MPQHLAQFPASMPPLSVLLRDLCNPTAADLARSLDAGERTARRWIADDQAPRSVMLSLFWVSTWGRQWLDADLHTRLVQQMHLTASLSRELDQARADLAMQKAPPLPGAPSMLYRVK